MPRRRRVPADEPADSLKSTVPCPGRFHRFQRNQTDRSTLSTAALYDLYTRYGQSVDKKALLPCLRNYPQVPPQAGRPIYRGFQVHKFLLNQSDKVFFHEIWLYHHHHALDLYPDLEARLAPICIESSLWTAAFAEGSPSRRDARSSVPVWPDLGTGDEYRILHLDFRSIATRHCYDPAILFSTIETNIPERQRISTEPIDGSDVVRRTASSRCSTWNLQKKRPGRSRASFGSTWNSSCQRRSGITTWRDFSLLDSRTSAEELESRSWMMTSSSRRAERASSR